MSPSVYRRENGYDVVVLTNSFHRRVRLSFKNHRPTAMRRAYIYPSCTRLFINRESRGRDYDDVHTMCIYIHESFKDKRRETSTTIVCICDSVVPIYKLLCTHCDVIRKIYIVHAAKLICLVTRAIDRKRFVTRARCWCGLPRSLGRFSVLAAHGTTDRKNEKNKEQTRLGNGKYTYYEILTAKRLRENGCT